MLGLYNKLGILEINFGFYYYFESLIVWGMCFGDINDDEISYIFKICCDFVEVF